jgi:dihydrofolate synthase/folylpolyglutamate synthase
MKFLEELAARRRFGMRPGLDAIRGACAALGNPQRRFPAIHVAGTNGKGAVCAILDAVLRKAGLRVGRYTSPHLVRLNERFFLDGAPIDDATLERAADRVARLPGSESELTFFEALTAVAFIVYAEAKVDFAVLETGLGGRLDATNVCEPKLCVITRVGLDHCDWLGDTVEKIASEKAGIVKPGVPVVLGANVPSVRAVVEARAKEVGAPFVYAPDIASENEIPDDFSLAGSFNRENAVTAIAALKVLSMFPAKGFSEIVWPGRFQAVGNFIVDGAHNPPAARALAAALRDRCKGQAGRKPALIAGFCGDKDVAEVLSILAPLVGKGYAVRTNNPRSLSAEETAAKMREAGIDAVACASLREAIDASNPQTHQPTNPPTHQPPLALICGSLFLAGEALVELGAYPWPATRFDASELLKV